MAALDPANFDAAKVNALIAASPLDDATKATLKAGVDAAATNPARLPLRLMRSRKLLACNLPPYGQQKAAQSDLCGLFVGCLPGCGG